MPLEEDVKQDVRKWSELFLEVPNTHLGGFPACPFAKKTWTDNKVLVEVKRKRSKAQGVGGKPTNVKTFAANGGLISNQRRAGVAQRGFEFKGVF